MEDNEKYIVEDEDGIVLYDDTDDQETDECDTIAKSDTQPAFSNKSTPAEEEGFYLPDVDDVPITGIIKDKDGYRLKTNEEIFTDEYMRNYDCYITEKKEKEKRQNRLVSIGVILFCIFVVLGFIALAIIIN